MIETYNTTFNLIYLFFECGIGLSMDSRKGKAPTFMFTKIKVSRVGPTQLITFESQENNCH